jgi:hypothetical protein
VADYSPVIRSREALAGSYVNRGAFPAGKYFLFVALVRRGPAGSANTFVRLDGRAFAPGPVEAKRIIGYDLGQDFPAENIKIRVSEVPPLAVFVTFQRPADLKEWEDFKNE